MTSWTKIYTFATRGATSGPQKTLETVGAQWVGSFSFCNLGATDTPFKRCRHVLRRWWPL